jgi:hypothetical protein
MFMRDACAAVGRASRAFLPAQEAGNTASGAPQIS